MEAEFWHNRWKNNLTGFHLDNVNPHLAVNWQELNSKTGAHVFVPLCGKSVDLIWLAEKGHKVIGVELSQVAVKSFFTDNNIPVERQKIGSLELWRSENIKIFCGDFFDLSLEMIGKVDAVYDRASLIALPLAMRQSYVDKMIEFSQPSAILLVTLEYEQSKMDGPPFSVSESEVIALYKDKYEVKQISAQDVLGDNEKFREKGLSYMNECVYQLTKPIKIHNNF